MAATHSTATDVVLGTPAFLAPEQVTGHPVGPAADVYALGLVLLEALTGYREYPGGAVESAVARLHRSPRLPEQLPAELRELLREMTDPDPASRPVAAHVAARLHKIGPTQLATAPPEPSNAIPQSSTGARGAAAMTVRAAWARCCRRATRCR